MVESEVKRLLMVLNCLSIFKIIERGGKRDYPLTHLQRLFLMKLVEVLGRQKNKAFEKAFC